MQHDKQHYKMIVLSNPVEGREVEYNHWYQYTHLADIVSLPGFVSAQRYQLAQNMMVDAEAYRYMAIYEIETDDLQRTLAGLVEAAETGALVMSEALNTDTVHAVVYSTLGEVVRTL